MNASSSNVDTSITSSLQEVNEDETNSSSVVKTYRVVVKGLAFQQKDIDWIENQITTSSDINNDIGDDENTTIVRRDDKGWCPRLIPIDEERIKHINPEQEKQFQHRNKKILSPKKKTTDHIENSAPQLHEEEGNQFEVVQNENIVGGSCSTKGLRWHAYFGTASEQLCALRSPLNYFESDLVEFLRPSPIYKMLFCLLSLS